MIDKDLVRRKLARLNMYLDQLAPIAAKTYDEYLADEYLRFSAERLIQLVVECASDINNHAVVESGQRPPDDYTSSFIRAADIGLITRELADKIKGAGGMRNIIIHEYMDIDNRKVYEVITREKIDFKEYIKQVDGYLDSLKP